jgi:hypothetical protein
MKDPETIPPKAITPPPEGMRVLIYHPYIDDQGRQHAGTFALLLPDGTWRPESPPEGATER